MLFIFEGSCCTGKSAVAEELERIIDVQVYTGKDYLRMAKNKDDAWEIFKKKLIEASKSKEICTPTIIYIISEKSDLLKVEEIENAFTIKFTADSKIIKERFSKRMNGSLPKSVETMLDRKISDWETVEARVCLDTGNKDAAEIAREIFDTLIKQ